MHLLNLAVNYCWQLHETADPANKSVQLFDYRFDYSLLQLEIVLAVTQMMVRQGDVEYQCRYQSIAAEVEELNTCQSS